MRAIHFLTLFTCALGNCLVAEEAETEEVTTATVAPILKEPETPSTWQNWVFAASALVTAVIGVVIISTNTGTYSHNNNN